MFHYNLRRRCGQPEINIFTQPQTSYPTSTVCHTHQCQAGLYPTTKCWSQLQAITWSTPLIRIWLLPISILLIFEPTNKFPLPNIEDHYPFLPTTNFYNFHYFIMFAVLFTFDCLSEDRLTDCEVVSFLQCSVFQFHRIKRHILIAFSYCEKVKDRREGSKQITIVTSRFLLRRALFLVW